MCFSRRVGLQWKEEKRGKRISRKDSNKEKTLYCPECLLVFNIVYKYTKERSNLDDQLVRERLLRKERIAR